MKTALCFAFVLTILFGATAYGQENEKQDFALALEQMLGHVHALEINLESGNSLLARAHATHPISELYDLVKAEIAEHDVEFGAEFESALNQLESNTVDVPKQDAQQAIEHVRDLIGQARSLVLGELSDDVDFKLKLVQSLVETAESEYEEGVQDGTVKEMVEYQDGSAFVWRAKQIFEEIKNDLPENEADEIEEFFADLESAIKNTMPAADVETFVDGISNEIDEILGQEGKEEGLGVYFEGVKEHLAEVKKTYAEGKQNQALSHATKAYLDNYEFLEAPIALHDKQLMEEIEIMMREDLRNMIKQEVDKSKINEHVDKILVKLEQAEKLVLAETKTQESRFAGLPPLKQIKEGVKPDEVTCGSQMVLLIKNSNGMPACVRPQTAERLVQTGWGSIP